jgi:hypothetical protein
MWELLKEGVTWKSPPLFNCKTTRTALVAALGAPPMPGLDSHGLGLFDAWALRFPCGLEVTVWLFHLAPDGTGLEVAPDELANVEIHANARDTEHILFHLPFKVGEVSKWVPDTTVAASRDWTLLRQDDGGNRFEVSSFTSRCEAEAAAAEFEARGHKQMYWVESKAVVST